LGGLARAPVRRIAEYREEAFAYYVLKELNGKIQVALPKRKVPWIPGAREITKKVGVA
jgi:hypothetical protein